MTDGIPPRPPRAASPAGGPDRGRSAPPPARDCGAERWRSTRRRGRPGAAGDTRSPGRSAPWRSPGSPAGPPRTPAPPRRISSPAGTGCRSRYASRAPSPAGAAWGWQAPRAGSSRPLPWPSSALSSTFPVAVRSASADRILGEDIPHHLVRDVLGRLAEVPRHHRLAARPGVAAALDGAQPHRRALGAVIVHNAGRVALLVQAVVLVGAAIDLQPGVQVLVDRGERVARAGPFEVAAALPRHV